MLSIGEQCRLFLFSSPTEQKANEYLECPVHSTFGFPLIAASNYFDTRLATLYITILKKQKKKKRKREKKNALIPNEVTPIRRTDNLAENIIKRCQGCLAQFKHALPTV